MLWLLIVPAVTVFFGLIVAVLADKLSTSGEKVCQEPDLPADGDLVRRRVGDLGR